jgi:hypothetical protein
LTILKTKSTLKIWLIGGSSGYNVSNKSRSDSNTTINKKEYTCFKCDEAVHLQGKPDASGWFRLDINDYTKNHECDQSKVKPKKTTTTKSIAFPVCAILLLFGLLDSNALSSQEAIAQTSTTATTAQKKFFLALFLQYVDKDNQTNIYGPNMGDNDQTSLRVRDQSTLNLDYISAAENLPGPAGMTFKSSQAVVDNAKYVKDLGFDFIEFNLERGLSPSSDYNNVVSAMKRAADAAHVQGLKFRAIPSESFTTQYGSQIAPYVDYYHIQAQSLQDDGIKAYSDYVHMQIANLKNANPNLLISVHVSTQQGNVPGLSLLETIKQCVDSVMDVADGVSLWFGGGDLDTLNSFVEWYKNKYS